jgi:proteasome accessory factor B
VTSLGAMAAKRAERLVNLVIALLSTRQYVTAARIRATVPGYEADDGSDRADEAFKRMFERDKAELREIRLTGEEAAAVGLALRLWESAQLAGAAHSALVKLKAAGVEVDATRAIPLQPRLDAGEPAFEPCYAAARDRRALEFDYQRPDEDAPARRHVQPWGVVAWHGRWYLVGLDLDRGAERVFRLSRVVGAPKPVGPPGAFEPPSDVDLAEVVAGQVGGEEHLVVVRARPGTAVGLRRFATPLGGTDDGDDRLELRTNEPGRLADQLAAYGADVVVEAPATVRDAVIARLTRLAAMGERV